MTSIAGRGVPHAALFALIRVLTPLCLTATTAADERRPFAVEGAPADEEEPLTGLAFVFFHDTDLQRPAAHGVEQQLNMELTGYNDCSKLWLGEVLSPVTGLLSSEAETDTGVRLYLDGKPVIDGWSRDGARAGTLRASGEALQAGLVEGRRAEDRLLR